MTPELLTDIYAVASYCRAFEEQCARKIEAGNIKIPVYLSIGQEYIASTIAVWCKHSEIEPDVFIQHRGHSTYLAFGGDPLRLALELLSSEHGCAGGMGGSASIHCPEKRIYGHDGLMGSQVPIAVGHCHATRRPTICFMGDAAAEEDYVLAALGWAATQRLPILFVVEDNDLAILTKTEVRRRWQITEVVSAFGLVARESIDDPEELYAALNVCRLWPALLNVRTTRLRWHAGAGIDNPTAFDRHVEVKKYLPPSIEKLCTDTMRWSAQATWRKAKERVNGKET